MLTPVFRSIATHRQYATTTGQRLAVSLTFLRKDKRWFSVPYAYLPVLWGDPPGKLTIEYHNLLSVVQRSEVLDEMERLIRKHRITWIREVDERQVATLSCVVTRIEIIRAYLSRDAGIGG